MDVGRLRSARTGPHLGPEIGMRLVSRLDLGEAELPVFSVINGATRYAGQPDARPILSGLTYPHLMFCRYRAHWQRQRTVRTATVVVVEPRLFVNTARYS